MTLPRVFVKVSRRPSGGWKTEVWADADGHRFAGSEMESAETKVLGETLLVPVVPDGLRPDPSDEHYAVSTGDAEAIEDLLHAFAIDRPKPTDARIYGRWLFQCLLAPVWTELRTYLKEQGASGVELALSWPSADTDLHALVWEAMHEKDNPLAALPDLLVVMTRVVDVGPGAKAPRIITRVPKVLFATGSWLTDPVIRPGAMFMGLLRKFDADGICVTKVVQNVSVTDLSEACEAFRPDVVHLVAHGLTLAGGRSVLELGRERARVGADQLLAALRSADWTPTAVVLSVCHSGGGLAGPGTDDSEPDPPDSVASRAAPIAARLVEGGIPIVAAMAGAISEPACRMFTTRLIDAIHQGHPLGKATAAGRAAAITNAAAVAQRLDWAMPTLFLSSLVGTDFRPLDPTTINRIGQIANDLGLRRDPVFIGRQEIFSVVDDLFAGDSRGTGFLAIGRDGKLDELGATRLLQETAFRLLRAGHIPLLLAGYAEVGTSEVDAGPPKDLREFLYQVLCQAVGVAEQFGLPPPALRTLAAADESFRDDPTASVGLPADEARQRALVRLGKFQESSGHLQSPKIVRPMLSADLQELASLFAGKDGAPGAGDPFGEHTRVVVLAGRVHEWTEALQPLLAMTKASGLGAPGKPIPVIATSSFSDGVGIILDSVLREKAGGGYRRQVLAELGEAEAAIGFQWVLLNPWLSDDKQVYVAARTTRQSLVQQILSVLHGRPGKVENELYTVVRALVFAGNFVAGNDEAAIAAYVGAHP